MAKEATFEGALNVLNALGPGMSAAEAELSNFPVFNLEDTDEPFGFDPDRWMANKLIPNKTLYNFTKIRGGKTSFSKILTQVMSTRYAAGGARFKTYVDDHRRNFDRGEWSKDGLMHDVEVTRLRDYRTNIIDPLFEFEYNQYLELAQFMIEYGIRRNFDVDEMEAMRVAMWHMFHDAHDAMSLPALAAISKRLLPSDFQALSRLATTEADAALANTRWGSLQPTPELRDLTTAAQRVGSAIEEFIIGKFGRAFGGLQSMANNMQQPLFIKDDAELSDEIIMLYQSWFSRIYKTALVRNDDRYKPNMDIRDEDYKMWRYLPYAEATSDLVKQNRGNGIFFIFSTHRPADYNSVSKATDREFQLANNNMSDAGMFLFGLQDKKGARDIAERWDLSTTEEEMLRNRQPGHFLLKVGSLPPIPVYVNATKIQKLLIESDSANQAMG